MKEFLAMWLGSFFGKAKDEKGQGLVEYGLIIVLVSIAVIVLLGGVGDQLNVVFQRIITELTPA